MRGILGVLAASALVIPATPAMFGGWAVIKVEDLPAQLEAGKATELTFMVLQHGQTPLRDLKPTVTVTPEGARRGEKVRAAAGRKAGQYVATITPASTGTVRIAIDANWHDTRIELLPIPVVARVARGRSDDATLGRELFVAKGCVGCHVKRDDPALPAPRADFGAPELTGRTWPAEWLVGKLANPAQVRGGTSGTLWMPDLDLTDTEIGALVTYLNRSTGADVSTR